MSFVHQQSWLSIWLIFVQSLLFFRVLYLTHVHFITLLMYSNFFPTPTTPLHHYAGMFCTKHISIAQNHEIVCENCDLCFFFLCLSIKWEDDDVCVKTANFFHIVKRFFSSHTRTLNTQQKHWTFGSRVAASVCHIIRKSARDSRQFVERSSVERKKDISTTTIQVEWGKSSSSREKAKSNTMRWE